jgi:hypothetical protein
MDDKRKKELDQVMREETRRGRRPIDLEARRKRAEKLADMRKLLTIATEAEFVTAMQAAGLTAGSQEFLEVLRIWRDFRS